jgi:hypothetical protein
MIHSFRSRALVSVALAGTAVSAVVAAGLGPADAAPAGHTLRLDTMQITDVMVHGVDVATDQDRQHGTVTGYDVTSCQINVHTHVANCEAAVARAGGMLFGHARINLSTGSGHGVITGGTGQFHGVSGTITVRAAGPDAAKIKLVYHS